MNPVAYAFGIVAAVLALLAIIELMRRTTLRERHAVWWLVGGVLALLIAIFPQTLTWAAALLGVAVPANLVFFIAIGLLFLVSLQYGAELTRVEDKLRTLAERTAFLERRVEAVEEARSSERAGDETGHDEAGEQR
ncbi:DUF2304 domain-containing protein [Microbacterium hominis]|uniref:DUF2304 domain-containing protein n=1 Tax=Microbacterium hominis TaxID=162426 RepID=A0A7D4PN54_9MICO|nr:DUF2304 domain-containing protein [Microbacterium hominis]QKJ20030.1 DUF2304 domain-containing protein [Microbacterium hominis]